MNTTDGDDGWWSPLIERRSVGSVRGTKFVVRCGGAGWMRVPIRRR